MKTFYDLALPVKIIDLNINQLLDEEKLLRLHPHWSVEKLEKTPSGLKADLEDYATEKPLSMELMLEPASNSNSSHDPEESFEIFRIIIKEYGVKELLFLSRENKTQVMVCWDNEQAKKELEENTFLWIRAIQEYLRLYTSRTLRNIFFRVVMNKMLLKMNPSQRKICILITKISIIETVVIFVIIIGYFCFR